MFQVRFRVHFYRSSLLKVERNMSRVLSALSAECDSALSRNGWEPLHLVQLDEPMWKPSSKHRLLLKPLLIARTLLNGIQTTSIFFSKKVLQSSMSGVMPAPLVGRGTGARTDLISAKAKLDEGFSPDQLAADPLFFPTVAKHERFFRSYYASRTEARRRSPRVLVLYGDSGCGKTIHANMCDPAVTYFVPIGSSGGTWFDGYDPRKHTVVVFNEWHGGRGSLSELLQWADPTPLYVNTKGGHMQFVPKLLIFTCNKDPESWYDWSKCAHPMTALTRRITNLWWYVKEMKPEWGLTPEQASWEGQPWYSFTVREAGKEDFHPARKCLHFIKALPAGGDLYGLASDPEIGDNVEEEDPDKFFL